MKIDSHQHYWKLDRGDYGWITPDEKTLHQDYLPDRLLPHLKNHGIDQTILVQAASTIEETAFMLELSDDNESIAGVVGWVDFSSQNYRSHYDEFKKHPKFLGFRLNIQDMPNEVEVLEVAYIEALTFFADNDVPIDLLFVHHQFPIVLQLLKKVPHLRGVVDHLGKPDIASQTFEPWNDHIKEIASYEKIYCKLSGMVTEADHKNWSKEDFVRYVQHVIDSFGIDRVMFGSDWPVALLAGSYDDVVHVVEHALPKDISESDLDKFYGTNAKKFYKL